MNYLPIKKVLCQKFYCFHVFIEIFIEKCNVDDVVKHVLKEKVSCSSSSPDYVGNPLSIVSIISPPLLQQHSYFLLANKLHKQSLTFYVTTPLSYGKTSEFEE